jgi:diacylglycerol kinase (ATP)
MKNKPAGITRILRAFGYSIAGLAETYRTEAAFRQETWLVAAGIPVACLIAPDRIALALMVISLLFVLIVELINSAIEAAIDRHGTDIHPLAKKAKDAGSAAVLIALIQAAATWLLMLV